MLFLFDISLLSTEPMLVKRIEGNPFSFFMAHLGMFLISFLVHVCSSVVDELRQTCSRSALLVHHTSSLTRSRYELHEDDLFYGSTMTLLSDILVMLFPILTCRASSPRGVATLNKACYNSYKLSQILTHSVPHPPTTPPPDEPTTYESVLTTPTPTPTKITNFNPGVRIVVWDVEGNNTEVEDTAGDVSFM